MQKRRDPEPSAGSGKKLRDRYWSLMLVGEHGRITPIPRARAIVIVSLCVLVLSIASAAVFGILYTGQLNRNQSLRQELKKVEQATKDLRDQKDELVAKLVLYNAGEIEKNEGEGTQAEPQKTVQDESAAKAIKSEPQPRADTQKTAAAAAPPAKSDEPKKKEAAVKLGAFTRQFSVQYLAGRGIVQAKFRIYNKSRPKRPLSGRIVVVFCNQDDPPSHWIPSPTVQLKDGKPTGSAGQAFRINNYRTVEFNVYGQKPPIRLNNAVIYVFSAEGELIHSESRDFTIEAKPAVREEKKPAAEQTETAKPDQAGGNAQQVPAVEASGEQKEADTTKPVEQSGSTAEKASGVKVKEKAEQTSPAMPDAQTTAQSPQENTNTQPTPEGSGGEQSQGADNLERR